MALTDDLISFWSLEEASGTRNDSHGTNHLTENSSVGSVAGKVGNCAEFEEAGGTSTQALSIANNPSLTLTTDQAFTVQAWINSESTASGNNQTIVGKITSGGSAEFQLLLSSGVTPRFVVRNVANTQGAVNSAVTPISLATWYCIHVWHAPDTDEIGVAVNAGTPDVTAWTTGTRNVSAPLLIGAFDTAGFGVFDGLIDQVGFWKRVLTSPERTTLYNGGNGLSYAAVTGAIPYVIFPRWRSVKR